MYRFSNGLPALHNNIVSIPFISVTKTYNMQQQQQQVLQVVHALAAWMSYYT